MDHELAKQLKDAGFKQYGRGLHAPDQSYKYTGGPAASFEAMHVYIPTLEELIEACGMDFLSLRHYLAAYWEADGLAETEVEKTTRGATPTEAVARLWLTLNAKTV